MRKTDHEVIFARVQPEYHKMLKQLAKLTGRTMTATLEKAIENELKAALEKAIYEGLDKKGSSKSERRP